MRLSKIKVLTFFIIVILFSQPAISNKLDTFQGKETYIIRDVPYFSQETNFFCAYSCYSMILNYLSDKNLSLDEILYLSGVGYSSLYSPQSENRLPMIGTIICQSTDYIGGFFGYSTDSWYPEINENNYDECWDEYWYKVKENLTNNNPIITTINPFRISSFRNLVDFEIPEKIIDIGPKSGHAIVLLGYNESNQSVCFNDPAMGYFGRSELGTYAWMDFSSFKQALIDVKETMGFPFYIVTFKKTDALCPSKDERFIKAFNLNIEKLKGNSSAYDPEFFEFVEDYFDYSEYYIGINATKIFQDNLNEGLQNQIITIQNYKKSGGLGIKYKLLNRFLPKILHLINLLGDSGGKFSNNKFDIINIEKNYTGNYLKKYGFIEEANLFYQESENWTKLSNYYNIFLEKGLFLSNKKSISLITEMHYLLGNIFDIQQKIIKHHVFDIDFKINEFINRNHVCSLSAGIIKNNTLAWYGGYGNYKGINTRFFNTSPNKDTIYMAASISKTITSTAIMQLYEKGLFNLDDDVNLYFPFSLQNPNFPDKNITIRMLLNHTSSINGSSNKSLINSGFSYITGYPLNFIKASLLEDGLLYDEDNWRNDFPPGLSYRYSNVGYAVLEYLVEYFSGISFEKYCKENVFHLLEMYNTSFHFKGFKKSQQAPVYLWKNGIFIRFPHYDVPLTGAGSLRTSVEDLSHFLIAHMNKGMYNDVRILSEENICLMHNISSSGEDFFKMSEMFNLPEYAAGYGLGWITYNSSYYGRKYSGHDGDTFGSHSIMRMDPDNKTGIIFFWNSDAKFENYCGPWDVFFPIEELLLEKLENI